MTVSIAFFDVLSCIASKPLFVVDRELDKGDIFVRTLVVTQSSLSFCEDDWSCWSSSEDACVVEAMIDVVVSLLDCCENDGMRQTRLLISRFLLVSLPPPGSNLKQEKCGAEKTPRQNHTGQHNLERYITTGSRRNCSVDA